MKTTKSEQLSQWYEAFGSELVLYARQLIQAGAEDIVHDAFIKLMNQIRTPSNVRAWLYTTVRNAAITVIRTRKRHKKHDERIKDQKPKWFQAKFETLIDASIAQKAMQKLPPQQREVVVMRIWGQMTLRQIAAITDCSVTTVHSRYKMAIKAMRKTMAVDPV